jgi:hypothetical protein
MRGLPRDRVPHSPQEPRYTAPDPMLPTETPKRRPRPPRVQVGHRAPGRDPVGTRPQTDKPTKCPFAGAVELSPAQLRQAAIAKLQCPECRATWAARLRGDTVVFPAHPPRATTMTRDISRWIKQEAGWTLYTRGE